MKCSVMPFVLKIAKCHSAVIKYFFTYANAMGIKADASISTSRSTKEKRRPGKTKGNGFFKCQKNSLKLFWFSFVLMLLSILMLFTPLQPLVGPLVLMLVLASSENLFSVTYVHSVVTAVKFSDIFSPA